MGLGRDDYTFVGKKESFVFNCCILENNTDSEFFLLCRLSISVCLQLRQK